MTIFPLRLVFRVGPWVVDWSLDAGNVEDDEEPEPEEDEAPSVRLSLPFGFETATDEPIYEFEVPDAMGEE